MEGWIKLYRNMLTNKIVMHDPETFMLWTCLLLLASHKDYEVNFGGRIITLKSGQLITGRKKLSELTGIKEGKIFRTLKILENGQQIEQQKNPYGSIITIVRWHQYQQSEQQNEQQMNNKRTLYNNDKNEKKRGYTPKEEIRPRHYPKFEPEEEIESCEMPEDMRERFQFLKEV